MSRCFLSRVCIPLLFLLGISSCRKLNDLPGCLSNSELDAIITSVEKVDEAAFLPGTELIPIPALHYYGFNGDQYSIIMDTLMNYIRNDDETGILKHMNIINTDTPAFIVPDMSSKIFAVCISTRILTTDKSKNLQNTDDIVWIWNSLINAPTISSPKSLFYAQGKTYAALKGKSKETVLPLAPGQIYYFTVWSWDSTGLVVNASSASIPFMVQSNLLKLNNYSFLAHSESFKTWILKSAKDKVTGADLTNTYPLSFVKFSYKCTDTTISYTYEDSNNFERPVPLTIIDHAFYINNASNDTLLPVLITPAEITLYKNPGREHVVLTYQN